MGSALSTLNVPPSAETYSRALEGLVGVDEEILLKNPQLPPLYAAGIKYKLPKHRVWRYPHEIMRDGWGDCEGLSCWRTAELHVTGADPDARVLVYRTGPRRWHAVVGRGDGWIDDPSIVCGMRERPGMPWTVQQLIDHEADWPTRAGMAVVGAIDDVFLDMAPTFKVVKHAEGYTGVLKVPTADGQTALVANTSVSPNAAAAVQKSANILRAIDSNDPKELAKLNPYGAAAVDAFEDPRTQTVLTAAQQESDSGRGLLAKPGDLLERPEITKMVENFGPYGALAAGIIRNPIARGIREASHDVFRKIPVFGKLF